jgi:hypothetical protein
MNTKKFGEDVLKNLGKPIFSAIGIVVNQIADSWETYFQDSKEIENKKSPKQLEEKNK